MSEEELKHNAAELTEKYTIDKSSGDIKQKVNHKTIVLDLDM